MRNQIMLQTSDERFTKVVSESTNYADICRAFNLRLQGSNYGTIKRRIARQGLSVNHFDTSYTKKTTFKNTIPLDQILVENSTYTDSRNLKKRLVQAGILKNKCYKCGLEDMWQGEPITLQLDHINGNHRNNRIENLRVTCPNCHSQTPTYSGKRLKKTYYCPSCHSTYAGYGKICIKCSSKQSKIYFSNPSVVWPDDVELKRLVWETPLTKLSIALKCSPNGIKMHCHRQNIHLPPHGFWQRIAGGHSPKVALNNISKPIRTPMRKWTDEERQEMVVLQERGWNNRQIAKKFKVAHTTIARQIRNYKMEVVKGVEPSH